MSRKQRELLIVVGIAVVAIIVIGALILSNTASATPIDFASIPQSRTSDGAFVLGDPDAPVTLVEFADFACSHCQNYKPTIDRFVREQVSAGRAKLEFRFFPTAGGPTTVYAGHLAECSEQLKPGSFWPAYELLFGYGTSLARYNADMGRSFATEMGLDLTALLDCAGSARQVETDTAFGRSLGVTGTPAIRIRYGDGEPTVLNMNGIEYGTQASYDILAQVVEAANAA